MIKKQEIIGFRESNKERTLAGVIYLAENSIDGKLYIGKTVRDIEKYVRTHYFNSKRGVKKYLYNAIRKYGWDNFSWWVIDTATTKKKLNDLEASYIRYLHTFRPYGYNLTFGGDGGADYLLGKSDEEKKKIREKKAATRKRNNSNDSTRKALKEYSEKNREEIRQRNKKIMQNPVTREKLRVSAERQQQRMSARDKRLKSKRLSKAIKKSWQNETMRANRINGLRGRKSPSMGITLKAYYLKHPEKIKQIASNVKKTKKNTKIKLLATFLKHFSYYYKINCGKARTYEDILGFMQINYPTQYTHHKILNFLQTLSQKGNNAIKKTHLKRGIPGAERVCYSLGNISFREGFDPFLKKGRISNDLSDHVKNELSIAKKNGLTLRVECKRR